MWFVLIGLVWRSYREGLSQPEEDPKLRLTLNWGNGEVGEFVNGEKLRRGWMGVLKVDGVPEEPVR